MRYLTAAAMLALVAGCAQLAWVRPGTAPATLSADLARCQQEARLSASRMAPSALASMPTVSASPGGGVLMQMPPPHAPGDLVLESNLLTSCMNAKGYRLVPAESAGEH